MKLFQTSALLSLAATAAGYASFSTTNGPRSGAQTTRSSRIRLFRMAAANTAVAAASRA